MNIFLRYNLFYTSAAYLAQTTNETLANNMCILMSRCPITNHERHWEAKAMTRLGLILGKFMHSNPQDIKELICYNHGVNGIEC